MISFLIAILMTPISCFLLWGRMIVTIDAFMHGCILSSLFYVKFNIPIYLSMSFTAFLFTFLFKYLKNYLERNEALQIVAVVFMSITYLNIPSDMIGVLFGDFNNVNSMMIGIVVFNIFCLYLFFYFYYNRIILISLNPTLDRNLNGDNDFLQFSILLIVCVSLGIIIEYVGVIFIVPMVMLPGIISRFLASSPFQMFYIILMINIITVFVAYYIINLYYLPVNQIIILIDFIILLLVILKIG